MNKLILLLGAAILSLPACATTTSFAAPEVDLLTQMTRGSMSSDCRLTGAAGQPISRDVDGALALIENFVAGYRCSMRAAADGRQPFQILSFLSLVGSTAAVALGASPDVAIAGGIGNSVFTAGNNYYAPQEQTEILSDSVDALLCIQTEAVGITAFESDVAREAMISAFRSATGGTVEIPIERQYFNMVASALLSVERVAAQRLSRRGSFDAAGIAAEIAQLGEEEEEAEDARDKPPAQDPAVARLYGANAAAAARLVQLAQLNLEVLRPRLQQCVTRAKS
jgi:hypothetical protein